VYCYDTHFSCTNSSSRKASRTVAWSLSTRTTTRLPSIRPRKSSKRSSRFSRVHSILYTTTSLGNEYQQKRTEMYTFLQGGIPSSVSGAAEADMRCGAVRFGGRAGSDAVAITIRLVTEERAALPPINADKGIRCKNEEATEGKTTDRNYLHQAVRRTRLGPAIGNPLPHIAHHIVQTVPIRIICLRMRWIEIKANADAGDTFTGAVKANPSFARFFTGNLPCHTSSSQRIGCDKRDIHMKLDHRFREILRCHFLSGENSLPQGNLLCTDSPPCAACSHSFLE
jgi:hypothetical protein